MFSFRYVFVWAHNAHLTQAGVVRQKRREPLASE